MSLLEWGEAAVAALLIARSYCLQYPPVPAPSWPWWLVCEGCFPFPDTPALWQREIPSLQRVIPNTRADEKVGTQGLYGGKLKWPIRRIIKQNLTKYDSEKGWRDGEWILPFQSWRPSARIHVTCLFPKIKPYNYSASKNSPEAGRSCKCPHCHNHTSATLQWDQKPHPQIPGHPKGLFYCDLAGFAFFPSSEAEDQRWGRGMRHQSVAWRTWSNTPAELLCINTTCCWAV